VSDIHLWADKTEPLDSQFYPLCEQPAKPSPGLRKQQRTDLVIAGPHRGSSVNVEKRYALLDNFSWTLGKQSSSLERNIHYVQGSASFFKKVLPPRVVTCLQRCLLLAPS